MSVTFYTPCATPRPVRLSEETRLFAWESLHGKYGDQAMKTPYVLLDGIEGFDKLSDYKKYDAALLKMAEESPLRICDR